MHQVPGNGKFRAMMIAAAAALLAATSLSALDIPRLEGRVSDHAGMISPAARDAIDKKLAQLELSDSTQVAVLTVPDLQGVTIEEFSIQVAEQWKIGRKKLDNGVIFLVSKAERKMRIEVGYGLEGRLTDLIAGRILDNEVRPAFRAGDFDAGFARGVDGIIQAVRGEYRATGGSGGQSSGSSSGENGSVTLILIALVIILGVGGRGIVRGTIAGGILFPLVMLPVISFTLATLIALVVTGIIVGLILSIIARAMVSSGGGSGGFGGWSGSSGGFGGSSFGGGGGFSGGGGSFGGGGSSSSW